MSDIREKIMKIPNLTPEREIELVKAWQEHQCEKSRHELINAHLKQVCMIAAKYWKLGHDRDELIQAGTVGLIETLEHFDLAHGRRFSTLAHFYIRMRIRLCCYKALSVVWNPKVLRAGNLKASSARDTSLDMPVSDDSEDTKLSQLVDTSASVESVICGHDRERLIKSKIISAMTSLKPRQRQVIELRYLGDGKATLEGIGREMGVSKERIRQIEAMAFQTLRKKLQTVLQNGALE